MNLSRSFVFALAAMPGFAAASESWEDISSGLLRTLPGFVEAAEVLNRNVGSLAVLPRSGNVVLSVNGSHGLFVSRDQGAHWHPVTGAAVTGRSYGSFSISVDPVTDRYAFFSIVLARGQPAVGALVLDGEQPALPIAKPDGGHDGWTWGMPAWNLDRPTVILAKEHHAWVVMWLSTDTGRTWRKLAFESRNPGVIDDTTFVAGNDDGIYRSTDQGQTWTKVSDHRVTGKLPVRYGANTYWTTAEGVIVSNDRGARWQLLGNALPDALWGPFFGQTESELMVVSRTGFHLTYDRGQTWRKVAEPFHPPDSNLNGAYDVVHPTNSYGWDAQRNLLYAAGVGGQAYRLRLR